MNPRLGRPLLSLALLLAADFGSHKLFALAPPVPYSKLGLRELRPLSVAATFLGQRALMGDVLWAGTLQYCGNGDNAASGYQDLLSLCLEATALAPDSAQVYKYGSTFLAWYVGRPQEARILLRRGILALRDQADRQRLALYLAAVEFQDSGRDRESLGYLARLFLDGDAPALLGPILANTFQRTGDLRSALRVWGVILERTGPGSDLGRRALVKAGELRSRLRKP